MTYECIEVRTEADKVVRTVKAKAKTVRRAVRKAV